MVLMIADTSDGDRDHMSQATQGRRSTGIADRLGSLFVRNEEVQAGRDAQVLP